MFVTEHDYYEEGKMTMGKNNTSETITENIFRGFYGPKTFIEKSAIPSYYGFYSKKGTGYKGYPDFFLDGQEYCIVVEAKATNHEAAEEEACYYALNNKINKDIVEIGRAHV